MMEAVRTSETSVDNYFTRQYNPEDSSEHINAYHMYDYQQHGNKQSSKLSDIHFFLNVTLICLLDTLLITKQRPSCTADR
jgi:hypothetical protein